MKAKAIFLDKDGTLIKNVPYNVDPEKIIFYEDVPAALQLFKHQGYKLIIVTNQPGIALGYFDEKSIVDLKDELVRRFRSMSVELDGFYYCPHDVMGKIASYSVVCNCKKPRPGLILRAGKELNIDLESSWMIGDILNDVEAGNRSRCRTVLIDNGNETEWVEGEFRKPTAVVGTLSGAAKIICNKEWNPEMDKNAGGVWKE